LNALFHNFSFLCECSLNTDNGVSPYALGRFARISLARQWVYLVPSNSSSSSRLLSQKGHRVIVIGSLLPTAMYWCTSWIHTLILWFASCFLLAAVSCLQVCIKDSHPGFLFNIFFSFQGLALFCSVFALGVPPL